MPIAPYLFFEGRCEEAVTFYKGALGAEVVMLMRFGEAPVPADPGACAGGAPPPADKIMHGELLIAGSRVMVSDGMASGNPQFKGVALSHTAPDADAAGRTFAALAEGGTVVMPLGPTFFSPAFGMVNDRFGVCWMIYTLPQAA